MQPTSPLLLCKSNRPVGLTWSRTYLQRFRLTEGLRTLLTWVILKLLLVSVQCLENLNIAQNSVAHFGLFQHIFPQNCVKVQSVQRIKLPVCLSNDCWRSFCVVQQCQFPKCLSRPVNLFILSLVCHRALKKPFVHDEQLITIVAFAYHCLSCLINPWLHFLYHSKQRIVAHVFKQDRASQFNQNFYLCLFCPFKAHLLPGIVLFLHLHLFGGGLTWDSNSESAPSLLLFTSSDFLLKHLFRFVIIWLIKFPVFSFFILFFESEKRYWTFGAIEMRNFWYWVAFGPKFMPGAVTVLEALVSWGSCWFKQYQWHQTGFVSF